MRASLEIGGPSLDSHTRDALVESVKPLLGYDTRGVFKFLTTPFRGLAERIATNQIRRKRTALTDATYPGVGDILLYQANGDAIRTFICDEIDKLKGDDVFLLAHSLGGIACFELLIERRPVNIKGLITFGSQAPFFYEIGDRKHSTTQPCCRSFPPWINFYDLNDPLSYVGEKLFGQRPRVGPQGGKRPAPLLHRTVPTYTQEHSGCRSQRLFISMLETNPKLAVALVVGVDYYEYGGHWTLAGPASDALKCVNWLTSCGVEPSNIALFLSTTSWKEDPEVAARVAKTGWKEQRQATRTARRQRPLLTRNCR